MKGDRRDRLGRLQAARPSRRSRRTRSASLLLFFLAACGGEVDGSSAERMTPRPRQAGQAGEARQDQLDTTDEAAELGTQQDPTKKEVAGGELDADIAPLGTCHLGPAPLFARCDWLADGRCYESKKEACDCICPRDYDSICVSGFYAGLDGRTEVYCN